MSAIVIYLKRLWHKAFSSESRDRDELDRLGALQQVASSRRSEYAEAKEKAGLTFDAPPSSALAAVRKRMDDAETAHYLALQKWENRESKQKSY